MKIVFGTIFLYIYFVRNWTEGCEMGLFLSCMKMYESTKPAKPEENVAEDCRVTRDYIDCVTSVFRNCEDDVKKQFEVPFKEIERVYHSHCIATTTTTTTSVETTARNRSIKCSMGLQFPLVICLISVSLVYRH